MKSLGESEWHAFGEQLFYSIFLVAVHCVSYPFKTSGGLDRSFCVWYSGLDLLSSRML